MERKRTLKRKQVNGNKWKLRSFPVSGQKGRQYAIFRNGRQWDNFDDRNKAIKTFRKVTKEKKQDPVSKAKGFSL